LKFRIKAYETFIERSPTFSRKHFDEEFHYFLSEHAATNLSLEELDDLISDNRESQMHRKMLYCDFMLQGTIGNYIVRKSRYGYNNIPCERIS
jgi:hypothetical protein